MLQLTRKADYGLRLLIEVAAHTQATVRTADVARRQQMPYQFLRKVVQTLVASGLLLSERGGQGGLSLPRPAETISMWDVVSAFGSPSLNRCTSDPPRCDRRDQCPVYSVWLQAQKEVERVLGAVSVADMVRRQAALDRGEPQQEAIPAGSDR
jgi:Rrf2 family protein